MTAAAPHAPHGNGTAAANGVDPATGLRLSHLADLRRSGLTDDSIRAAGLKSLYGRMASRALGWDEDRKNDLGHCLAIPFFNFDGTRASLVRLRPDSPRKGRDGKPIKYESPKGSSNAPYFPPAGLDAIRDPSRPLIFTEGEKKSLAAAQAGFACVGLVGVEGWSKRRARNEDGTLGERELLDQLAALPLQGRQVFICYDSDAAQKPDVHWAEWRLAEALEKCGAVVKVVRLAAGPPGADGKPTKVGLDDFLLSRGPDALRGLMVAAGAPVKPAAPPPRRRPDCDEEPDDPHRQARIFVRKTSFPYAPVPRLEPKDLWLRFWRGAWLKYDGAAYREVPAKQVEADLVRSIKRDFDRLHRFEAELRKAAAAEGQSDDKKGDKKDDKSTKVRKVTKGLAGDVLLALKSESILPADAEPPCWLDGEGPFPPGEVLVARNALVSLAAWAGGAASYCRPPSLNFFGLNALDYDFSPDAAEPVQWLAFLARLWPDDPEAVALWQEWCGYCLTPDTSLQKILLIVGPPRSGKGTLARVLAALVGRYNVAGPTLSSLGGTFGLWPLLSKSVAIFSDARLGGNRDENVIVERLLSISGEDSLTVDRKHNEPVTVKLACRLVLMTNELPGLRDASEALARRFLLLHTPRSWYGQEDTGLTDRLLAELPGILLWAIEGRRRLRERGRFLQPASAKELLEEVSDLSSPVGAFVRECCVVGPDQQALLKDLFARWKSWCERTGRKPGAEPIFARNLLAAVPTAEKIRPREGEKRARGYQGVGLLPPPTGEPAGETEGDSGPSSGVARAGKWLAEYLAGGTARKVHLARDAAGVAGINTGDLYRARTALGVEEFEDDGYQWWRLPTAAEGRADKDEPAF